jgi:ATP-dependent Zn protease
MSEKIPALFKGRTYTQSEVDARLWAERIKILEAALESTREAVKMVRDECAEIVQALADEEEGEVSAALKNAAEAILDRSRPIH